MTPESILSTFPKETGPLYEGASSYSIVEGESKSALFYKLLFMAGVMFIVALLYSIGTAFLVGMVLGAWIFKGHLL